MALLPQGCTPAPMDRRLVVLLPVVYRLRAAVRGRVMRDWLRGAGGLRAGAASAADSLAGLLGLDTDLAHADGEPLVGLALDFSRCYDRLPLEVLREVARRAGVPDAVPAPMTAC